MNRNELLQILNSIFHEVFDDNSLYITESTSAQDIDEWDSLIHIILISNIEQHFHIKFTMLEISRMKNIKDMLDLIQEKLK